MLQCLVEFHSKVNAVSKNLLDRAMNTLVADVTSEALRCFKQVRRFGMGGMLRATLEIEFMHQILQKYVTNSTSVMFTDIYTTISDCYERRSDTAQQNLQAQLDGVKKTLGEARRATSINFVCFKKERYKTETTPTGSERERSRTPAEPAVPVRSRERTRDRERTKDRDRDGVSEASGSERRRG
ncbi:hypothetical protein FRB99_007508 [Tulasnella sp. 403]|nr:hypothetical protein FRB99_007508 [Tulasnella sp. 403]